MMTRLSRNEFESILRSIGEAEYHNNHPYHVRMYRGQCSIDEIRAWALNRFCYQRIIPAKDALVMARLDDIEEELEELKEAVNKKDLKEAIDALTDILYVTYGAGHAFGVNLDNCFEEVQNSNMSKLGNDGKPIFNEKGKVMKGPNYFKPDLNKFLK